MELATAGNLRSGTLPKGRAFSCASGAANFFHHLHLSLPLSSPPAVLIVRFGSVQEGGGERCTSRRVNTVGGHWLTRVTVC